MFQKLELTRMAQAMAAHSGARMGVIAQNVANADTPGYKAQDLPDFARIYGDAGQAAMRATRPGHLNAAEGSGSVLQPRMSAGAAAPNGNSVSLETEMVKTVQARQSHEMALAISRSTSGIIRTSLGRGK